jgi:quercetin dioxygenase-like cupin family protein
MIRNLIASLLLFGQEYILDGGGKVVVHKPFGEEVYSAVVAMDGEYPGSGLIAHDEGRAEFIYVLDGAFEVKINGELHLVKCGENILIEDGDSYSISGNGRCMVLVHDQPGGETKILQGVK